MLCTLTALFKDEEYEASVSIIPRLQLVLLCSRTVFSTMTMRPMFLGDPMARNLAQVQSTTNTHWWTHTCTHTAFNHSDSHLLILLFPWPQLVKVHDSMFLCARHDPYMERRTQIVCCTQIGCCFLFPDCECGHFDLLQRRHYSAICWDQSSIGSGFVFKFSSARWLRIDSRGLSETGD